jgi:cytochrome c oxidase subunit 4
MSDEHGGHHANYFAVFIALCICTGLSVMFDLVHIPSKKLLIVLVLSVAVAKALFVMTYFMHLKFERAWKYVLLAPTIILAMGLPLALLPDVGVHYYTIDVPQIEEAAQEGGALRYQGADAPRSPEGSH